MQSAKCKVLLKISPAIFTKCVVLLSTIHATTITSQKLRAAALEAPVMIAEKRKLVFFFSSQANATAISNCQGDKQTFSIDL